MRISSLAAVLLLGIACNACAQQQAQTDNPQQQAMRERLQAADTDHDGRISKAEAEAKLPRIAKRFDQLDGNHDGYLDADELKAMASQLRARRNDAQQTTPN